MVKKRPSTNDEMIRVLEAKIARLRREMIYEFKLEYNKNQSWVDWLFATFFDWLEQYVKWCLRGGKSAV